MPTIGQLSLAMQERLTDEMTNEVIRSEWQRGLELAGNVPGFAKNSGFVKNKIEEETGVRMTRDELVENLNQQKAFADRYFDGDARAASEFIRDNGQDTRFANMEFNADNLAQMKQTVEASSSAEIQPRENFTEAGRPVSIEFELGNSSDMIAAMGAQGIDLSENGLRDLQDRINQLGEDYSPTMADQRAIATVQEQVQRFGTAEEISVMSEIADGAGMDKFLKGANLPEGQRFVGEHRPEMQERLLDHYGENSIFWKPQASNSEIGQDTAVSSVVETGSASIGGSMLAMLSGGECSTNLLSIISLDDQGRPDLNRDGVGGIEGLIKALGEGFGERTGGLSSVSNDGSLLQDTNFDDFIKDDCWGTGHQPGMAVQSAVTPEQSAGIDGPTPPTPMGMG